MTVYTKQSYEDQDDGRILKAARKQHYIMFPAPITSLNDELKTELRMKSKKEEEEDDAKFCSLKDPMDQEDKESKTYVIKVNKLLNYSHSRNPSCAHAHTHGQIQTPREPPNYGVCSRVCALSQDRT
jgi:hypothetical protein